MSNEEIKVQLELLRRERLKYNESTGRDLTFLERTGLLPMLAGAGIAAAFLYSVGALSFLSL